VNKVILNWQRPPWEGDREVVKRSGSDEPMWVAIHKCVEAMLGISLYSYLYLNLAKMLCFFLSLMRSMAEQVLPVREGCGGGGRWGGRWHKQCMTHVSKCKNNKIKEKIKK
jgi:hypothetical protein